MAVVDKIMIFNSQTRHWGAIYTFCVQVCTVKNQMKGRLSLFYYRMKLSMYSLDIAP
jgi:hypothetical protein